MKPTSKTRLHQFACAVLFTAVAASARADFQSTLQSHGPGGYWPFDETTASSPPYKLANSGTLGSVVDAYAIPQTTNGVTGKIGSALKFTNPVGTGHCGSRADVVYNRGLNTPVYSVEFWVQPGATTLSGSFDG